MVVGGVLAALMTRWLLAGLVGLSLGALVYRRVLWPWDRGNPETVAEGRKRLFGGARQRYRVTQGRHWWKLRARTTQPARKRA